MTMNLKKVFCCVSFLLILSISYGQYDPKFTQIMYSGLVHNPAFAGYLQGFNGRIFYRNQFTGLHSPSGTLKSPYTASLYVDDYINKINSGVGIQVDFETFGPSYTNSLVLNYSYSIKLNRRGDFLNLGLSAGFFQYGMLGRSFSDDDIIFAQSVGIKVLDQNVWRPNFRVGALYHSHFHFVALSLTDLFNDLSSTSRIPVMHLSGGYLFDISSKFKIRTMVHYREDFNKNPSLIDLNAMTIFINRIWVGGIYRMGFSRKASVAVFNSVASGVMFRVDITSNINLGYAYEIPLNNLGYNTHYGSHEVTLGINFIKPSKFTNPRYF